MWLIKATYADPCVFESLSSEMYSVIEGANASSLSLACMCLYVFRKRCHVLDLSQCFFVHLFLPFSSICSIIPIPSRFPSPMPSLSYCITCALFLSTLTHLSFLPPFVLPFPPFSSQFHFFILPSYFRLSPLHR